MITGLLTKAQSRLKKATSPSGLGNRTETRHIRTLSKTKYPVKCLACSQPPVPYTVMFIPYSINHCLPFIQCRQQNHTGAH